MLGYEDAIKAEGGRLDFGKLSHSDSQALEAVLPIASCCRDQVHHQLGGEFQPLRNVNVVLVDNKSVNAFAYCSEDGEEGVGINHGLYLTILDFAQILWGHNSFLKTIAPTSDERDDLTKASKLVKNNLSKRLRFGIVPLTSGRRERALNTARIALEFVVLHEYGHLMRAHMPFIRSRGNLNVNAIAEVSNKLPIEFEVMQQLETDADNFAAQVLFHGAHLVWNRSAGSRFPDRPQSQRTFRGYMAEIAIGVGLGFLSMDIGSRSPDLFPISTHPAAGVRLMNTFGEMERLERDPTNVDYNSLRVQAYMMALQELTHFCHLLGLSAPTIDQDPTTIFSAAQEASGISSRLNEKLGPFMKLRTLRDMAEIHGLSQTDCEMIAALILSSAKDENS